MLKRPGKRIFTRLSRVPDVNVDQYVLKDVFVSTMQVAGVCLDTANHNGEDLQASPSMHQALIGFDLSAFPFVNETAVQSATLHLVKSLQNTMNAGVWFVQALPAAGGDWDEATLVCSNYQDVANIATVTAAGSTSTGATNMPVNVPAFLDVISSRMGTTRFTIRLRASSNLGEGTSATFYSKDGGTSANAPRLSFTYRAT